MNRAAEPALAFAETPVGLLRRWRRAAAILLRHPRAAAAILASRIAGRRVRARQAGAALFGLDHAGLLCPPAEQARLLQRLPEAPPVAAADLHILSLADLTGEAARRDGPAFLVLEAPGHALLPGAAEALASVLANDPTRHLVYGDALHGPPDGRAMPLLRPAFDPDYLLAVDYIGPVLAIRRAALAAVVGAGDPAADGRDLAFRVAERFGPGAVAHLPRLVSRGDGAVAEAGGAAIPRRVLDRTGGGAVAITRAPDGLLTLVRPLPEPPPLVSLIVPTRDRVDLLRTCIDSLTGRTDWPHREILICDNDSREPETLAYFRSLEMRGVARIVPCPGPFDFAGMNNAAAAAARGRLLAFVNNDVEALHPDWLERLVREAVRPEVGAVGAKLLDGRGRIQHGGVLLGPGGLVTHAHRFFPGDAPGYLAALRATRAVSAVTAACLVVEARKFAAVGGFDGTAFAVDFNDVDLCLRLGAAGHRTLFVPGAVLRHDEAASRRWTPEARARHLREVAAFRMRWGPLLAQDPHYHPGFDPDLGTYARLRPGWPGTGPNAPR